MERKRFRFTILAILLAMVWLGIMLLPHNIIPIIPVPAFAVWAIVVGLALLATWPSFR